MTQLNSKSSIPKPVAERILSSLVTDASKKHELCLHKSWMCQNVGHDEHDDPDVPIILIERGPKSYTEIVNLIKGKNKWIVLWTERKRIILKSPTDIHHVELKNESDYDRIIKIFEESKIADLVGVRAGAAITEIIKRIKSATDEFTNRGVFSTNYIKNRLFENAGELIDKHLEQVHMSIGKSVNDILEKLGWNISSSDGVHRINSVVSIIITNQSNLSVREGGGVAPSYIAVSSLSETRWAILTNGKVWRLYTKRISASTTNYFEITLDSERISTTKYLIAIFSKGVYDFKEGHITIDQYFDESKKLALELEDDLASTIMHKDMLFIDIVKGVLDHNMKTVYKRDELEYAKYTSLRIMYRIWFVLYAESRNLLPVYDEKYIPISLRFMRDNFDEYLDEPDGYDCWRVLLKLFSGIRNGSIEHNLPQYDGGLFQDVKEIDGINIRNKFIVKALRGILERNGDAVDYASLGVRHLGSIYESLLEFSVKQAEEDILLEKSGKEIKVKLVKSDTYTYKKNDLYLASKGGIAQRKTTASYYTPDKIVEFLVKRGLEPIFSKREKRIKNDIIEYKRDQSETNYRKCVDGLLDIQVLDPAMGSGHFLVEALNRITMWVTNMLKDYPDHPIVEEIEADRRTILNEQKKKGITIDMSLLEDEVLLKRKIMKRCIFGVDLNPMAVDLAKLSLWLDSFAIGVPLTYMDHHIKVGDSTIGLRLSDLQTQKNTTMDNWIKRPEKNLKIIEKIWQNTDVTIEQAKDSKHQHEEYQKQIKPYKIALDILTLAKINENTIPDKRDIMAFVKRVVYAVHSTQKIESNILKTLDKVNKKSQIYRFFHWELEMMDAFTNQRNGFDLITGNPPWDKIRPNAKEFFSSLEPNYDKMSDAEKELIHQKYKEEFKEYKTRFDEKREFYKKYKGIGENTDFELWRIMMSRMMTVLAKDGVFSMIVPSALTNSRGAAKLRKHILSLDILSMFIFENRKKIFPIASGYRFALITVKNSRGQDSFPAKFYLWELEELKNIMNTSFLLSKSTIEELSPNMLIIHEVKTEKYLDIIKKLHSEHPVLSDTKHWSVKLGRELNLAVKDKDLIVEKGGSPVLKSKNFHQHTHKYSHTKCVNFIKALNRLKTMKIFEGQSESALENPRLVYREVSGSGDTRTMIACISPQRMFLTKPTFMVLPRINILKFDSEYHKLSAYLCAIFNSTTFDFILKPKIDKNVETYHVYGTPVPWNYHNKRGIKISKLSGKLFLAETYHTGMAESLGMRKDTGGELTIGQKIDIVAELDFLCALQYGLTIDEYKFVLNSFKVSEKKFTQTELKQTIDYRTLQDGERNEHMRIFYGMVYVKALEHYNAHNKKNYCAGGEICG